MRVDLHMHSTYSDGTLPLEKMIPVLVKHGIKTFSITDHDTVEALDEAFVLSKKYGIELLPGIEISCEYHNREVHILGYHIDHTDQQLLKELINFKQKRLSRADRIIDKLKQEGILIQKKQLDQASQNGVLGRPHIADLLVEKNIVATRKEAFKKYLGNEGSAYVPREKVTAQKAISLIIQAGGVPVIAHPGLTVPHEELIDLLALGAAGIEVFHPDHNLNLTDYYYTFAQKNDLVITGGTDWHGDKDYKLFHPFSIPNDSLLKMKELRRTARV